MEIKPMLAGKFEESKVKFPVYIQPKFDGIRALNIGGQAISRTLKPIPNKFIQSFFGELEHSAFDGELIVGKPTSKNVYRDTMSGVMSEAGEPDFKYYVFDYYEPKEWDYSARRDLLFAAMDNVNSVVRGRIEFVVTHLVNTMEELMKFEASMVTQGYEGAIVRAHNKPYKYGRSTTNEGNLLKLKRFLDDEAEIIGFEELMSNQNEATKDALGYTKRSSHQENKVPAGTMGALVVKWRNPKDVVPETQTFSIGTGFDLALRLEIWNRRDHYMGKTIKFKYVEVGGYDLPRFPVFLGFREDGV